MKIIIYKNWKAYTFYLNISKLTELPYAKDHKDIGLGINVWASNPQFFLFKELL